MQKGFTLIEVLVTVLILGILTSIAVPQYQKAVMRSRFAQMLQMSNDIYNAQIVFHDTYNRYAQSMDELDIHISNTPYISCEVTYGDWTTLCSFNMPGKGTIAVIEQYFGGWDTACCAYKANNYAGAFLCETEMGTKNWFNGCGDDGGCHCYHRLNH